MTSQRGNNDLPPAPEPPRKRPGAAPGTLEFTGTASTDKVRVEVLRYDASTLDRAEIGDAAELSDWLGSGRIAWVNVVGLHDVDRIRAIGEALDFHDLLLEDVLNVRQRPKCEEHGELLFTVVRMLRAGKRPTAVHSEQLSIVLGENFVVTFQERRGDVFDPLRERIEKGRGRVRKAGADYLFYAILDAVVDEYFPITERLGTRIDALEDAVLETPGPEILREIQTIRRRLTTLRKAAWPLRDVVAQLLRDENPLVREETKPFLRDVHDHVLRAIDSVEGQREILTGVQDLLAASIGNRMNEVMKTLTLIATIFIPLTFLAGIYGMNFEHMPELAWPWMYPLAFWGLCLVIGAAMLGYFRYRRWL
ncbi:MAG: magnesium and cobalt transport protein CorA [Deltaproteobacteria bacterium]|nr:MAG: magnesium and cobalt transport protein CorA [Deltaproteobacteria bacterium]